MSNEERNDEMVDEASDAEDVEATEEEAEEEYSYTSEEPPKTGGGSAGIWVIIVLVVVALIGVGWYQWQQDQEALKKQEADRQQAFQRQLSLISEDVTDADAALEAGDLDRMIESLEEAVEQLDIMAMSANSAGDSEAANQMLARKTKIQNAIDSLQPVYEKIEAKREELRALEAELMETAQSSLASVRSEFGPGGTPDVAPPGDAIEDPAMDPAMEDEEPMGDDSDEAEEAEAAGEGEAAASQEDAGEEGTDTDEAEEGTAEDDTADVSAEDGVPEGEPGDAGEDAAE